MKKIMYSFLTLNLMISSEICHSSSELIETPEKRILETIEEIKKYHKTTPLTLMKSPEGHIKTRSYNPDNKVNKQNISKISILATAIKENSINEEVVTKKIIPGRDGRKRIKETNKWPYSVHGAVFVSFPSTQPNAYNWGSGTLIAPNLVLTAAHNLYNIKTREEATTVRFSPAINGKELYFGEPKVIKHYFPKAYKTSNEGDFSLDYGLLLLDHPVGKDCGHFGLAVISESNLKAKTINVTGYPGDKVANKNYWYEMWTMSGPVHNIQNSLIYYEIDTYGGQSGSGIWYQEGEDYLVTGVHVGGDAHLGINQAVLLTQERYDQITLWIKDSILQIIDNALKGKSFADITTVSLGNKFIDDFIGDIGVQLFTSDRFPHLIRLDLSYNNISDAGAKELAKLTSLTMLDLSSNNIGDEGVKELVKLTNLTTLDLSSNNISDSGVKELTKLTNLTTLDLGLNSISEDMERTLYSNFSIKEKQRVNKENQALCRFQ